MKTYRFLKITSPKELNISYKIRKKVFCEEQKISEKIEFDNLDHLCEHFLISKDKFFIATARLRPKNENTFKIERVAVLPEFRRLRVGSLLINKIIETYFINIKNKSIILHSQVAVEDFYKSLNFTSYGNTFYEDGIPHIAMMYKN
ncbi:GNAT family N-acetyltransferase [Alphaproteobacteria bacterium]|nr:GNAT family N-acetyltransferase [Alphaproteobacteria bacterium]